MAMVEEKGPVEDNYTQDGTVDLKGRPVLRSKTGKWKACYFIVGYEVFERMAFYGIASNLVVYLTNKLHEGTVESSNNISNLGGCSVDDATCRSLHSRCLSWPIQDLCNCIMHLSLGMNVRFILVFFFYTSTKFHPPPYNFENPNIPLI